MGILIPKLFQLLKEEYNLQKGVKKDIEFLLRELPSMHATLHKVANIPRGQLDKQVKIWADEVRELSYIMEDVVDSFLAIVHGSEPAANSHKLKELMKNMGNLLSKGKTLRKIENKIKGIKVLVKEVADRRDRYMVNDAVANPVATTIIDPRMVALFKEKKDLVGTKVTGDEIESMLTQGDVDVTKKQLKIIPIFGCGGLGKTTIAKVVFDGLREKFKHKAFISVGQKPDLKKILRDIFLELDIEGYKKSEAPMLDEKQLIQKLQELLQNKRYFIVIDDIWDVEAWKIIRCALKDSKCGSIIITTTRIFDVATRCGEVYRLKPLSLNKSEILFYTRLYGGKCKCPFDQSAEISKKILEKCGGVPLAILTIASVLEGKPIEDWSKVYGSICFGHGENKDVDNTRNILLFSYYDLPFHLRTCLLHLCIYPEDYTIMKGTLIWKWVGEGFIKEESGIGQFEVGERYFNELINKSMIQPVEAKDLSGIIVGCRVHDLVLDMISVLSEEEKFVTVLHTSDQNISLESSTRRLAIQKRVLEKGNSVANMCTPQLRSFNATICDTRVMPSLSSFGALRVLAMESCCFMGDGNYHLNHLGSLLQLRYLGLRNMPIDKLPEEIGKLQLLQTLDLKGTHLEELPQSVGMLRKLKCMNADSVRGIGGMHLGNLTSFEELTVLHAEGFPGFVVELEKMTELRKLYIAVCVGAGPGDIMVKALVKSLGNLQKIQVLHIGGQLWCNATCYDWGGSAPPRQLRDLRLRMDCDMLPVFVNPSLLPNLTSLWVKVVKVKPEDMVILGSFPHLFTLILDGFQACLPDAMADKTEGGGRLFPKLSLLNSFQQGSSSPRVSARCQELPQLGRSFPSPEPKGSESYSDWS
uniref:Uncharacterized protein n=1 Tax=Avena sativa TaxID=4498 RepID=A0ACD5TRG3_AVESA